MDPVVAFKDFKVPQAAEAGEVAFRDLEAFRDLGAFRGYRDFKAILEILEMTVHRASKDLSDTKVVLESMALMEMTVLLDA
jgi:hypothetical protein